MAHERTVGDYLSLNCLPRRVSAVDPRPLFGVRRRAFDSAWVRQIVVLFLANLAAKWIVESRFYFIATELIRVFIDIHRPGTDAATDFNLVSLRHE